MIVINCDQRSVEWYEARLGKPTASAFGKIISANGKERKGQTPLSYMLSLIGEKLTRTPVIVRESPAMARGKELEDFARAWYSEKTGRTVNQVGFVLENGLRWGCSPDGLCVDRGIEIKCPQLPGFLAFAVTGEIPDDHFLQMQACMWITGIDAWDYVVYTDVRGLLPVIKTVTPDEAVFQAMESALPKFCDELNLRLTAMKAFGNGVSDDTPIDLSELERELTDDEVASMSKINAGEI